MGGDSPETDGAQAVIQWQPIETAPKGGLPVLVYVDQATVPLVALVWWYSAEEAEHMEEPLENVGWWRSTSSCGSEKLWWEPTHWAVWEPPSQ